MLAEAKKILTTLGVKLNREKTRIVHVAHGFEFLGYKIKRGSRPLALSHARSVQVSAEETYTPILGRSRSSISRIRFGDGLVERLL